MLRLLVPAKVHFPLKSSSAYFAGEWLETRVLPAMSDQVGGLAEGFSAHRTLVGLLTCMDVGVLFHVGLLMKPLAAVLAGIGPGVRVDQQMGGQSGRSLEALAALFAFEASFCRVNGSVLTQTHFVSKGFIAQFAGEGPLSAVGSTGVHF